MNICKKSSDRKTNWLTNLNVQNIISYLGLAFVIVLFAILTQGKSVKFANIQRVLLQSVLLIIGSVGATFTIAHGHLDFSLGGIMGMSVALGGLVGTWIPELTIPAIIAVAVFAEVLVVLIHIALDIPSFIVSLAMMFITKGILIGVTQTVPVGLNAMYTEWDKPSVYFIVLAVVLVASFVLFEYTKIGKYNKAIGSNFVAAITNGIPVNLYKVLAFIVSGVALGICAFLNFVRAGGVSATTGAGYEINVLISLVLGGTSLTGGTSVKMRGAIIGCLILTVLENGLVILGIQPAMMGLIKGVLFLTAIALAYDRKTGQIIA